MKKLYFTYLNIILIFNISCQTSKYVVHENNIKIIDFEVDRFRNQYLIYDNGDIIKSSVDGKKIAICNYSNYGTITGLDIGNSQKVMLYYEDFQVILILDNSLSLISEIRLNKDYRAAGFSNDGNIWLYDPAIHRIIKMNFEGTLLDQNIYFEYPFPENICYHKIIERDNMVFLADKNLGLFIFSNLGYFQGKVDASCVPKPYVLKNTIYFFDHKSNKFLFYDLKFKEIEEFYDLNILNVHPEDATISENTIYYLSDNQVKTIPLPDSQK